MGSIEDTLKGILSSHIDLDYIKSIVLDEHSEEVMFMDFLPNLELKILPWSKLIFEANSVSRGSTILNFSLTFEEPPRNQETINVYRLMELVIISAIENLQFIKDVRPEKPVTNSEIHLSMTLRTKDTFNEKFEEDLVNAMLQSIQSTILNLISEDTNLVHCSEKLLEKLYSLKENKEVERMRELTPRTMRDIVKCSRIADKDMARVIFEVVPATKKKKSSVKIMTKSTNWLFPWDFRRLADLPPEYFKRISQDLTTTLPVKDQIWCKEFVRHLWPNLNNTDLLDLQRTASADWPYPQILQTFSDNEGTLGGLIKAVHKFKEAVEQPEDKEIIRMFCQGIEMIRTTMFEEILEGQFCPSQIPYLKSMDEFEDMSNKFGLKLKTNPMRKFGDIRGDGGALLPGAQLWIYHKRPLMRSYAHVAIIVENDKFIHVSSPKTKLKMRARAIICEESQDVLSEEDLCFVVHPKPCEDIPPSHYSLRAKACLGIRFDYDAELTNCETFCNGVHGIYNTLQVRKNF